MKIFEIIFILLLLIPVALLMRYLISRLSMETPRERRFRSSRAEEKPTFREIFHPEDYYDDEFFEDFEGFENYGDAGYYEEPYYEEPAYRQPSREEPAYRQPSYEEPPARPEKPRKKKRIRWRKEKTEPVVQEAVRATDPAPVQPPREPIYVREKPVYTPDDGAKKGKHTLTELKRTERIPFAQLYEVPGMEQAAGEKKKQARSEKQPSKRQLRKNRERARKRERSRRNRNKEES